MSTIDTERRSRKRRRCERCRGWIEKGQRYIRSALPPWAEPNYGDHWWTLDLHGPNPADCPVDEWAQP